MEEASGIASRSAEILETWERLAREIPSGRALDRKELLDNFPDFLKRLEEDLERLERDEAPRLPAVEAVSHAISRLANGYEIGEVLKEWLLLRDALVHTLAPTGARLDLVRSSVERGIVVSVDTYASERGRALDALDRVSRAALEAAGLEELLAELAQALAEGLPSVDAAAVLLRDGDDLVARAAAGREAARARRLRVPARAAFVERLNAPGAPPTACLSDRDAPELRLFAASFRSVCAAPLRDRGTLVGLAVVGSLSAFSLSVWDQRLFGSMGARAGLAVAQQRLRDALHEKALDLARSEARARRSVRWLESVIAAAREGILVVSRNGDIALANEAAADAFGVSQQELLALSLSDFPDRFRLTDEEGRPAPALAERALNGDVVGPVDRVVTAGGSVRVLRASAGPLVSADGSIEGAVVVVGDVTALRSAEREREGTLAELEAERARLERANRFRDEILAIVSHDLRNPLGVIVTSTALLERAGPAPSLMWHVDTIGRAARRMAHLIGDLLDTASIEAGRLSIRWADASAAEILNEAADIHEPTAREKGIVIERSPCDDGTRARCDRERILQVFSNLIANALRFGRGGDRVTLACSPDGDRVRFVVSDTGPGIAEGVRARLFEPFVSGAEAHGANVGLGLYISREIVRAHGGELEVESAPGDGARFSFTVPRAREN